MFPDDTVIAMADRTEKLIADIVKGDCVLSGGGDESVVVSVVALDYEGSLVRVKYQDNGLVVATPGQIFVTERGNVPASSLVPGDRLETPYYGAGWLVFWEVESSEHFLYQGKVRGLRLDGPGHATYCAGGVLAREASVDAFQC